MDIDIKKEENKEVLRSTRLVCAKLYEGGLLSSYEILNNIKLKPFKGKSPEFELDIDRISKEAEVAFKYHIKYALLAIVLSFLGLTFYIFSSRHDNDSFVFGQFMSYAFSLSAICILLLKPVSDRNIAFKNFSKESFNQKLNQSTSSELSRGEEPFITKVCDWLAQNNIKSEKDEGKKQNVIIFGKYLPFLGAGKRIRSWNFVIDLSIPKKDVSTSTKSENGKVNEKKVNEISVEELYETVCQEIKKKDIPNISYKYNLFADGEGGDEIDFLLKDSRLKPCTYLEKLDLLTEKLKNSDKCSQNTNSESVRLSSGDYLEDNFRDFRTYLNISQHDIKRSTLFSTFLHFSKLGKELFAEISFYALTPINENIYNIDRLPKNTNFFSLKSGLITLGISAIYIVFARSNIIPSLILFALTIFPLIKILRNRTNESEYKEDVERIKRGEPYNYGLMKTFRETIASPNFKNYFSAQDIVMIENIFEKCIMNSIADFLDSNGVDSSDLRENVIPIVNNGIINGSVNNSTMVAGDKVTTTFNGNNDLTAQMSNGNNNMVNQVFNQIGQKVGLTKEV